MDTYYVYFSIVRKWIYCFKSSILIEVNVDTFIFQSLTVNRYKQIWINILPSVILEEGENLTIIFSYWWWLFRVIMT